MKLLIGALILHHLAPANALALPEPRANEAVSSSGAVRLSSPTLYQSPRFRWWWPEGWVDPDEIESEITEIITAGFGGAEISDVWDSDHVYMDPKIYGFGESRWNAAVLRAYQQGNK